MAGTLTISTLSDGTNSTSSTNCIQGSAKAWCSYNASSQTIRASYNISSVTYNGAGAYTFNFTNAFANTNLGVICTTQRPDTANGTAYVSTVATTYVYCRSVVNLSTAYDGDYFSVSVNSL